MDDVLLGSCGTVDDDDGDTDDWDTSEGGFGDVGWGNADTDAEWGDEREEGSSPAEDGDDPDDDARGEPGGAEEEDVAE